MYIIVGIGKSEKEKNELKEFPGKTFMLPH